jgi:hypothetical protein
MPEGSQYLCLIARIPNTSAVGGERHKVLIIIEKPTGEGHLSGPVRLGDTVFLQIWNSANTSSSFGERTTAFQGSSIGVTAFTPRCRLQVNITRKIFRFRIIIENS